MVVKNAELHEVTTGLAQMAKFKIKGQFFKDILVLLRFYIGCDMCANWFHGACVQVSQEAAQSMDEWTCAECTQARRGVEEEELYCLCRQPYDERK